MRLEPSQFLWKDYTEKCTFEVISMYVRLVFCPSSVLTSAPSARVTVACLSPSSASASTASFAFIVARNNVITVCSYYRSSDSVPRLVIISETLDDFYGGGGHDLFIVNVTAMALAVTWSLGGSRPRKSTWLAPAAERRRAGVVNRVMRMNSMASTSAALFAGDGDDATPASAGAMIKTDAYRNQSARRRRTGAP